MAAIAATISAALLYKPSLPLLHGESSFSGQMPFESHSGSPDGATLLQGWSPQRSPSFPRLPLPSALT
jgi:hypothetical protein